MTANTKNELLQADWRLGANSMTINLLEYKFTRKETENFIRCHWQSIAISLVKMGYPVAFIRYSISEPPLQVWNQVSSMATTDPLVKVFTAPVIAEWSQPLLNAWRELEQQEAPSGFVKLGSEEQIWINDAAASMLSIAGLEAVKLNMRDLWHPADMEELYQKIRDVGEGWFEHTFRCRMWHGRSWAKFTHRYKVFDGGFRLGVAIAPPETIPAPSI